MRTLRQMVQKALRDNGATETKKAAITPADLAGQFSLGQDVVGFWDKIVARSPLLAAIGVSFINSDRLHINELTLGTNGEDIIRPGVAGVDPGDTVTLGDDQRDFVPEEGRSIVMLTDDLMEDNLEGNAVVDRILSMLAIAYANEVEKALWTGVKVGTSNGSRGSFTGCFDGFLQQAISLGHIIDATDYSDRYPVFASASYANNKHLAAEKALPDKYYNNEGPVWFAPPTHIQDCKNQLKALGFVHSDEYLTKPGVAGLSGLTSFALDSIPFFSAPLMRANHLVKGTGTAYETTGTGKGSSTLSAIAKARATTLSATSSTGFATGNNITIGPSSNGAGAFGLNAESRTCTGTPSGGVITVTSALTYDHASGEYIREYSVAPTADGINVLLTAISNLRLYVHREMRFEMFREPRKAATSTVISSRIVPVLFNPDAAVVLRGMKKLV